MMTNQIDGYLGAPLTGWQWRTAELPVRVDAVIRLSLLMFLLLQSFQGLVKDELSNQGIPFDILRLTASDNFY